MPPSGPYPVAAPPKEPPPPDMQQVLEGLALEEAAKVMPPGSSSSRFESSPALNFDMFPVPIMVLSEQQSKKGLFARMAD